jgi:hypothetical protein
MKKKKRGPRGPRPAQRFAARQRRLCHLSLLDLCSPASTAPSTSSTTMAAGYASQFPVQAQLAQLAPNRLVRTRTDTHGPPAAGRGGGGRPGKQPVPRRRGEAVPAGSRARWAARHSTWVPPTFAPPAPQLSALGGNKTVKTLKTYQLDCHGGATDVRVRVVADAIDGTKPYQ